MFLPAVVFLILVAIFPNIYSLFVSFTRYVLTTPGGWDFIGVENFKWMVNNSDFVASFGRTTLFAVLSVGLTFSFGLLLALVLKSVEFGRSIYRNFIIFPLAVAPAVFALFFRFFVNTDFGMLNFFLENLGFEPVPILSSPTLAFASVLMADVWYWTPFVTIIMLAGLLTLPEEPFEAAEISGASKWQKFRHLTLPMLKPLILIVVLIRSMDAFRVTTKVLILTRGGPGNSTELLGVHLWRMGFDFFKMGKAAAIGLFMLFVVIVMSWILLKVGKWRPSQRW